MGTTESPSSSRGKEALWVRYFLCLCVAVGIVLASLLATFLHHDKEIMARELVVRARMHFHSILIMRRWNADYGGVFVEKKPGVESNPYLINPDIATSNGTVLTKRNPALMTREISRIFDEAGLLRFRITSLNPLNPDNKANSFEQRALRSFALGETIELFEEYEEKGRKRFRYMAPLYTEESCLTCHGKQGYSVGDVRGGISVAYDITELRQEEAAKHVQLLVIAAGVLALLLGTLYAITRIMQLKLQKAQQAIETMAITDELTGLYNRRYAFQKLANELKLASRHGTLFTCLMLDIDYFKDVNDTYGHPSGDKVLQDLAGILRTNSRATDTVARFGGEEFMIILPLTDSEGACSAAEKIRKAVLEHVFKMDTDIELHLTVSVGCSTVRFGGDGIISVKDVVAMADKALYRAKRAGKNRVESLPLVAGTVGDVSVGNPEGV
ncbi:diguanylate cyclase [Desulfovibrio mangrovi]|uniref:diguanylate cyclase n=1 Tax=Desulfovibrio mangrovi TaxID=2976983 RepID=UPI002245E7E3|nr:diguanylate cyclase [Desulfovibrio mangrovi]UZP68040.1 diguanylate cyclase [Desulfovibrio mangrovi]